MIQKADRRTRRRATALIFAGGLVGALLMAFSDPLRDRLLAWIVSDPAQELARLRLVLLALAVQISIPMIAIALWLARLASRVAAAERFPPPGMEVITDTRILIGAEARRYAWIAHLLAGACTLLALTAPLLFWRIAALFERATS